MVDKMGKRFERLRKFVAREYEHKGYSVARSNKIGYAVAGKIARERKEIREHPILAHIVKPKRIL